MKEIILICILVSLVIFCICGFVFFRVTMKYIDRKILEEDCLDQPEWDKGIGMRCSAYAVAIIWPCDVTGRNLPQTWLARKYRRDIDYLLSCLLLGSCAILVVFSTINYLI